MWVAFSHLNENIKRHRRICSTETCCSLSPERLWQEFSENPTAQNRNRRLLKKRKKRKLTECKSKGGARQPTDYK